MAPRVYGKAGPGMRNALKVPGEVHANVWIGLDGDAAAADCHEHHLEGWCQHRDLRKQQGAKTKNSVSGQLWRERVSMIRPHTHFLSQRRTAVEEEAPAARGRGAVRGWEGHGRKV